MMLFYFYIINRVCILSKLIWKGMILVKFDFRINKLKIKGRINIRNVDRLELDGEDIDEVEGFVNFGSNISKDGGFDRVN